MKRGSEDWQRCWLTALRTPGLSGRKLIEAVAAAGGIGDLCARGWRRADRLGLSPEATAWLKQPDIGLLDRDEEWLAGPDRKLLAWDDEAYPALLRRIPSPPAALFVHGDAETLWQPQIAIIGSRNPTAGGLEHGRDFSTEFSRRGITITSGLASGIDSAAHEAALAAGGRTVAVTGTGPDTVYPANARALAAGIVEQGAVVTEFPVGTPPRRRNFPSRNRIISGLSLGVLVIEAGLNSGTLITARQAGEQGRDVFALPGSLHNPLSRGCHRLIREGARLVESVEDVLEELAPLAASLAGELQTRMQASPGETEKDAPAPGLDSLLGDPDYRSLWDALAHDPLSVDELVRRSGQPVQSVSSMLLMLELKGLVTSHSSGRYCRSR